MYVVLVYDISQNNNGQKRWSHVFKICKKYLSHIQNSVFEGEISKVQLVKLQQDLKPYIDKKEDSVIIFKSRQERWLDKRNVGQKKMTKLVFFITLSIVDNVKKREVDNII